MLNLVKPKYFMPVHGEHRHKVYHARLAEKTGVPKPNIFILDDGEVLEISGETASLLDPPTQFAGCKRADAAR